MGAEEGGNLPWKSPCLGVGLAMQFNIQGRVSSFCSLCLVGENYFSMEVVFLKNCNKDIMGAYALPHV